MHLEEERSGNKCCLPNFFCVETCAVTDRGARCGHIGSKGRGRSSVFCLFIPNIPILQCYIYLYTVTDQMFSFSLYRSKGRVGLDLRSLRTIRTSGP